MNLISKKPFKLIYQWHEQTHVYSDPRLKHFYLKTSCYLTTYEENFVVLINNGLCFRNW